MTQLQLLDSCWKPTIHELWTQRALDTAARTSRRAAVRGVASGTRQGARRRYAADPQGPRGCVPVRGRPERWRVRADASTPHHRHRDVRVRVMSDRVTGRNAGLGHAPRRADGARAARNAVRLRERILEVPGVQAFEIVTFRFSLYRAGGA
jgi:hypothetical protein